MEAGINLFSLRTLIGDEDGFLATALALREMGYSSIQFSGAPYDADVIRRVSEKSGLPVVLTHVPLDRVLGDTDALMAEHESFGCHIIGIGWMPPKPFLDADELRAEVEKLDRAAAHMRENGFEFSYHHHHTEMFKVGGKTVLEFIADNSENINITVDTYWLQYGGADVCAMIDRLAGRVKCVHLKDYQIKASTEGGLSFTPAFAPVGAGTLDFPAIVGHSRKAGAIHFLVEQDDAVDYPDPLDQAKQSIDYIRESL